MFLTISRLHLEQNRFEYWCMDSAPLALPAQSKTIRLCRLINALVLLFLAIFFFLMPAVTVIRELSDPNIRSAGIPQSAWSLYRSLTPRYARWANDRLKSTRATELSTSNISGTEWPLFGSVFYLWAAESLQDEWDR